MNDEDDILWDDGSRPVEPRWSLAAAIRRRWGFIVSAWSTFWTFWRWAKARHAGQQPDRTRPLDHEFSVWAKGPNYNDVTLRGRCSGKEAQKLFAFLSIYEEPRWGVVVRAETCLLMGAQSSTSGVSVLAAPGQSVKEPK